MLLLCKSIQYWFFLGLLQQQCWYTGITGLTNGQAKMPAAIVFSSSFAFIIYEICNICTVFIFFPTHFLLLLSLFESHTNERVSFFPFSMCDCRSLHCHLFICSVVPKKWMCAYNFHLHGCTNNTDAHTPTQNVIEVGRNSYYIYNVNRFTQDIPIQWQTASFPFQLKSINALKRWIK